MRSSPGLCGCVALALGWAVSPLRGEVILDGTVGPHAVQSLPAPYQITSDLGDKKGPNLFHSFSRFNIETLGSATFSGPGDVQNILARVTGGTASSIDGKLSSTIPGANLFFINPAGIIFGSKASLEISGSFFATTADYIRLGTDGRFDASNPANSVLTVASPSAFGFLGPNPAAIRVNASQLTGPALKTLGLVAGDVTVRGGALLQADDVQMVSVRSAGEAGLQLPNAANGLQRPAISAEGFARHGAVSIGDPAVPGQVPPPRASVAAGRVVIRGGTLVMQNADVTTTATNPGDGVILRITDTLNLADQSSLQSINLGDFGGRTTVEISAGSAAVGALSQIGTLTADPGSGGDLHLTVSGALRMVDGSAVVTESASSIRGGDIFISAGSIALESAAILSQGDVLAKSGDIHLDAAGALSLTAQGTVAMRLQQASNEQIVATAGEILVSGAGSGFIFQDLSTDGFGGSVTLTSRGHLAILAGGIVAATTAGRDGAEIGITAGSVLISGAGAPDLNTGITAENASAPGGRGGEIRLAVSGSLDVINGGVISTNTLGEGAGGSIDITARDVLVTGRSGAVTQVLLRQHGISSQNITTDPNLVTGNSGSVRLTLSGKLEVRDAGEIVVDTSGAGQGGSIGITAESLSVATGGIIAARTFSQEDGGRGGDLTIHVAERIDVAAGGQLSVGTFGSGSGGAIAIQGDALRVSGADARISAVSGSAAITATGRGGNVLLDIGSLEITRNGRVTAGTFGPGSGGSIEVNAMSVFIADDDHAAFGGISAQTLSTAMGGVGGNLRIDTQTLEMLGPGAAITTQSLGSGNSGRIQIAADTISMRNRSTIQSSSAGTGRAGSISIAADGDITLLGGSSLSVASDQSDAGDIRVRSASAINLTDSSITAQAAINGGSIDLRARDLLFLTNSQITAAAGLNGGNIFIDPVFVVLDHSLISANAIRGRGGNVRIISDFFLAPPGSFVTASSERGIDGSVRIDALDSDLTNELADLPSVLLNAESLLRELCTVKIPNFSSFIVEGRGGLPPLPGEALPSLQIVR